MLCVRAEVVPVECVIRGYITGSAWKEYRAQGTLAGEALPAGLRESGAGESRQDRGDRAAATVFFKAVGQKKLKLRFARLQVVG